MLSNHDFMQWFQGHVLSRWPRCEFTKVQLEDWYWRLKRYDADTLTQAVRRHHVRDEPRRPSLKAIHEHACQLHTHASAGLAPESKSSGVPEAHTYIQCIAKDEHGSGPVGWFVPVLLWPFHRQYTQAMYDRSAQQQCDLLSRSRGGVWEVVAHTTYSAMRKRQWQLTGDWERIREYTAKNRTPAVQAVHVKCTP